jgi:signal transduction histidine kinase
MIHFFTFVLILTALSTSFSAHAFDVTGQILGVSRSGHGWILLHEDVKPKNFACGLNLLSDCRSGDIIRARGLSRPGKHGDIFLATNIVRIGKRPAPQPLEITGGQIHDRELLHKCVRVRGVISAVKRDDTNRAWNQITLRTPTGKICAAMQDDAYPFADLIGLTDADVTLYGYVSRFGAMLRFLGHELNVFDEGGIAIHRKAAGDPFDAPPLNGKNTLHRRRVEGIAVAADRHRLYLTTPYSDFFPVQTENSAAIPVGARITAVGYPQPDLLGTQLTDALIRIGPPASNAVIRAESVGPETLFRDARGVEMANYRYYGRLISLRGHVLNTPDNIRHTRWLQLSCGQREIPIDVSRFKDPCDPAVFSGCRIKVTGYCLARFERDASSSWIPTFKGFTLVPRYESDITVLSRPPWWTATRLFCVISALLVLLAAILVWNQVLRAMSERRGASLAQEKIEHVKTQLKIEERTRLAVELHDSLSQTLTGIALQVDSAATANAGGNAAVGRFLATTRQMLTSCRKELQCCLWDLRSRTFEEKNLNEAILRAIGPQSGRAKIAIRFDVPRERLSESTAEAILRMVRELVSNAVRHGGATEIRIAGECRDGTIRFSVRDNGDGFDPATAPGPLQGHFGLRGIRERLTRFGGTLEVESRRGSGAKVTATLKMKNEWTT